MGKQKDVLPNRAYVVVTFAAATTTVVYTSLSTDMGAQSGNGWLISRFDVQPLGPAPSALAAGSGLGIDFQVATGRRTAMVPKNDTGHVGTATFVNAFTTSGHALAVWPLTWVGPVLVANKDITCLMDGSGDASPFQSLAMLFTIWFNWIEMTEREWIELAQASGVG